MYRKSHFQCVGLRWRFSDEGVIPLFFFMIFLSGYQLGFLLIVCILILYLGSRSGGSYLEISGTLVSGRPSCA